MAIDDLIGNSCAYDNKELGQNAQFMDDGKLADGSCRKPLFILEICLKRNQ